MDDGTRQPTRPAGPSSPVTAEAQAALERARASSIDSGTGRSVHGRAAVGFGVLIGAFFALTRTEEPWLGQAVLTAGYVLIALAIVSWQTRSARVVPRGARRLGRAGLLTTIVVMVPTLGVLNSIYRDGSPPLLALVASGIVVAAPLVVAGALISREQR